MSASSPVGELKHLSRSATILGVGDSCGEVPVAVPIPQTCALMFAFSSAVRWRWRPARAGGIEDSGTTGAAADV